MPSDPALSTVEDVLAVANQVFAIADRLHRRLNGGLSEVGQVQSSTYMYSLLVEEYGLRARAAILRNDAAAHIVSNTTIEQSRLVKVLTETGEAIVRVDQPAKLRALIAGVSTLCVGLSPGKGRLVDFLAIELEADLQGF